MPHTNTHTHTYTHTHTHTHTHMHMHIRVCKCTRLFACSPFYVCSIHTPYQLAMTTIEYVQCALNTRAHIQAGIKWDVQHANI